MFDGKAHILLPLLSLFYFIFLLFLLFLSERLVIVAPTKITNDTRPFFRRRRPLTGTRRLCIAPADDRRPGRSAGPSIDQQLGFYPYWSPPPPPHLQSSLT